MGILNTYQDNAFRTTGSIPAPTTSEFYSAKFSDWWDNSSLTVGSWKNWVLKPLYDGQFQDDIARMRETGGSRGYFTPQPNQPRAKYLDEKTLNEQYGVPGYTKFNGKHTEAYAYWKNQEGRQAATRAEIFTRYKANPAETAASFGLDMAYDLLDPISLGANFIPVVGEAKYAKLVGRFGKFGARTLAGGAEALAGQLITEPLYGLNQTGLGQEYDFSERTSNILGGTLFGGALHLAVGYGGDAWGAFRNRTRSADTLATQTRAAISQLLDSRSVSVSDLDRVALTDRLKAYETLLGPQEQVTVRIGEDTVTKPNAFLLDDRTAVSFSTDRANGRTHAVLLERDGDNFRVKDAIGLVDPDDADAVLKAIDQRRASFADEKLRPKEDAKKANKAEGDIPRVFRQSTIDDVSNLIFQGVSGSSFEPIVRRYFATHPSLALGQKGNIGVLTEFSSLGLKLTTETNRPWAAFAASKGLKEVYLEGDRIKIRPQQVLRMTVDKNFIKGSKGFYKRLENQLVHQLGFLKEDTGSQIVFTNPVKNLGDHYRGYVDDYARRFADDAYAQAVGTAVKEGDHTSPEWRDFYEIGAAQAAEHVDPALRERIAFEDAVDGLTNPPATATPITSDEFIQNAERALLNRIDDYAAAKNDVLRLSEENTVLDEQGVDEELAYWEAQFADDLENDPEYQLASLEEKGLKTYENAVNQAIKCVMVEGVTRGL